MVPRMKLLSTGLVALVIALTCAQARADDERVPEAQKRYEAGMASYHLEEYEKEIEEWEAGYRLKPAPQFLYNIAQAYRLSKRPDKALSFYQKYLKLAPRAANRAEVERHVETLTRVVEQQRQAAERPSQQPMPLKSETTAPTEPRPAPTTTPATTTTTETETASATTTTATTPAIHGDLTASAPPRDKPVYKKGWFWGVMAGAVVVAAAAVTLGVVLSHKDGEQVIPAARF